MKIVYDTDLAAEMVKVCKAANDEIAQAQNLILKVKSHKDWTCKEKKQIDEYMERCRKDIKNLASDQSNFLKAVSEVARELLATEKNIASSFETVEELLSSVLAIPSGAYNLTEVGQEERNRSIFNRINASDVLKKGITSEIWHGPGTIPSVQTDHLDISSALQTEDMVKYRGGDEISVPINGKISDKINICAFELLDLE